MRVRTSNFIALVLLVTLAATAAGCKAAGGTAAGDTTPTASATSTADASATPSPGKVTTPAGDSAERAAFPADVRAQLAL
jgi:hypothetical protein